jgi:lipopolysaccharide transport system permease protein
MKQYLALIYQKSLSDFKAEARRGSLGIIWWLLEPLLYVGVFYVIFSIIFHRGDESSIVNLLTALVVWKWFDSAVRQSSNSISSNVGLIRQVYLPKIMFPLMVITTATMRFLIIFPLLIVFIILQGYEPSIVWVAVPIIMIVQLMAIFAIGGFLAAIIPFAPDLRMLIDNGMTLLFFLSGIFFDINNVSPNIKFYLYMNPMIGIIESYRDVLLDGQWPDLTMLFIIATVSMLGILLACYILNRFDRQYLKII